MLNILVQHYTLVEAQLLLVQISDIQQDRQQFALDYLTNGQQVKMHILTLPSLFLWSLYFWPLWQNAHLAKMHICTYYTKMLIIEKHTLKKMKKCKNANLAHLAKMKSCTLWQLLWHDEAGSDLSVGVVVFWRTPRFSQFFDSARFSPVFTLDPTSGWNFWRWASSVVSLCLAEKLAKNPLKGRSEFPGNEIIWL